MTLENVKIGDTLAVRDGDGIYKAIMKRVTKTQIACDDRRNYLIRSGREVGGSRFWARYAQPWTADADARLAELKAERDLAIARRQLAEFRWRNLDAEQCAAVKAALIACGALQ